MHRYEGGPVGNRVVNSSDPKVFLNEDSEHLDRGVPYSYTTSV
jgi:hypothetical protein